MIQFIENGVDRSFSVDIEKFDQEDYIKTIQSLLCLLKHYDVRVGDFSKEIYHVCTLIEAMLPDVGQIINVNEIELFKQYKQAQKHG
jgi:hypothetical protein